MSYLLDIATAVPEFQIEKEDMERVYSQAFDLDKSNQFIKKINLFNKKTKIKTRYSCIPDYNGKQHELYIDGDFKPTVEKRMEVYRKKVMPLATKAIDKLLIQTHVELSDVTHLITVSCTGLFTPGLEFMIAEKYGLEYTEKYAVNFMGCYAAMKALKQAHYISQSNPKACILILSIELCSLHFYPSELNEDVIANLLFADGAAAAFVCGDENIYSKNKMVLQINDIGTAFIPNTSSLMSWNITSSAFRMYLSMKVVNAIKENIHDVVTNFLGSNKSETAYWAIHPGGVKIVEAVKESLQLTEGNVADSMSILEQYGNMSSPTILFILSRIFNKIKAEKHLENKKVFSCAFGPGLNIEMIYFSSVNTSQLNQFNQSIQNYAVEV